MELNAFTPRLLTAAEVLAMVEAGILSEDERVELIEGRLVTMSPQGPTHSTLTVIVHRLLAQAYGEDFHVKDHSPIDAGPISLPEPDVALVRGEPRDFLKRHPSAEDLLLVVEVAYTTHREARAKTRVYAGAGVPTYWLLDVPGRSLEVFSDPDLERGEYANHSVHADGDAVPLPELTLTLAVADMLD